jgi:hypothetical protein
MILVVVTLAGAALLGAQKFKHGIPLASTGSAVISAASHGPADAEAHLSPIK